MRWGSLARPPVRSLSKAYYWWESNKSPAKSGRERRRRFFDGTNCQFRPIHRSSPPRPGRISLAPIAHTCELGEARVGYFPLSSQRLKRANFYSFVPLAGGESASRTVSFRRAEQTGAQLFAAVKSIACPTRRSFVPSRAAKLFGLTALHRGRRRGKGGRRGGRGHHRDWKQSSG